VAFLAERLPHESLHLGNARHTADQHDFVDVARLVSRVLQSTQDRAAATFDEMIDELLELGPRKRYLQMLGPGGIGRDER